MENTDLINRLSRIIGQLEGIKKKLASEEQTDCKTMLQQLKAAVNALKKFGEAYLSQSMEDCLAHLTKEEIKEELNSIISSAFSL